MVRVEPVVGAPAATVALADGRALVIADYHAGIEHGLRYEDGVRVPSRADDRRDRLVRLVDETEVGEVIVVGDLMHSIGDPARDERDEIEALIERLPADVAVTVVKGNHDGDLGDWLTGATVHEAPGVVRDTVAFSHGHTWPPAGALEADVLVIGHEHPRVRLEDEVGGAAVHRVWLRGRLRGDDVAAHLGVEPPARPPRVVVLPAFNALSGGTWINQPHESFLVPYLPEALDEPEVYLLDGTRLGRVALA